MLDKICPPDGQPILELVWIPALAAPKKLANPVRIEPRCWLKKSEILSAFELSSWPILWGPTIGHYRVNRSVEADKFKRKSLFLETVT